MNKRNGYGRTPEQILSVRSSGREYARTLRTAMKDMGVPYKCAICGLLPVWNKRVLVLHVDHIDGNYLDCQIHNVRFLCPNCHTQTATFGRAKVEAPLAPVNKGYLTDEDAEDIRREYGPYVGREYRTGPNSAGNIAKRYGVSINTIYRTVRGMTRNKVENPTTTAIATPAAD